MRSRVLQGRLGWRPNKPSNSPVANGKNGALAGMSLAAAQQAIGVPGFGAEAQTLHPFSGLQEGLVKLS